MVLQRLAVTRWCSYVRLLTAVRLAKDAVLKAQDLSIEEGLDYERRVFYLLFATEDQKEGMAAFVEKRPPKWKGQ